MPCYPRLQEVVRDWESYSPGRQASLCYTAYCKLVAGVDELDTLGAALEEKLELFVRPAAPQMKEE